MEEAMAENEEKRKPQKWKCPRCGNVMTTHVGLSESPTCRNPSAHSTTTIVMTETK
jgi:rubrerythrin